MFLKLNAINQFTIIIMLMVSCSESATFRSSKSEKSGAARDADTVSTNTPTPKDTTKPEGNEKDTSEQPISAPPEQPKNEPKEDPISEPPEQPKSEPKEEPKTKHKPELEADDLELYFDARADKKDNFSGYSLTYGKIPGKDENRKGMILSKHFYEKKPIDIKLQFFVDQLGGACTQRGDGLFVGLALDRHPDLEKTSPGGHLGITGISTYGFEFDTYRNEAKHGVPPDPTGNHIGFDIVTPDDGLQDIKTWLDVPEIVSSKWHNVHIRITDTTATYTFDGNTGSIELPAKLVGKGGHFFVSSAVGCSRARFIIKDLLFANE